MNCEEVHILSGNVNKRLAIAAGIQYLYSRGNYDHQGNKDLSWQVCRFLYGRPLSDACFCQYIQFVSQENGGISDTRFILDPDEVASGQGGFDSQSIPVYLYNAFNRVRGRIII